MTAGFGFCFYLGASSLVMICHALEAALAAVSGANLAATVATVSEAALAAALATVSEAVSAVVSKAALGAVQKQLYQQIQQ